MVKMHKQKTFKVLQVLSGKRTLVDHVTSFVLSEYS